MQLITGRELAEAVRASYYTLMRWARTGRIPSVKMGRLRRFDSEEVMLHLRQKLPADIEHEEEAGE
jgi:excisionase family DNA binding protein